MKIRTAARVAGILAAATAAGADMTADAIMEKANQAFYYAGQDGRSDVQMTIEDGRGGTRTRELTILRMNEGTKQKFYVYFKAPADVRKMAYLVWKNPDGDDDRWLFLPALNLEKRIAPGDKRTSFAGSDFFYEDVSGRSLRADRHELVQTSNETFVVKNTPLDPASVEFGHYLVWIDKTTYLPMKSEYYNPAGKLYRTLTVEKVETIDGIPTAMVSVAADLTTGSRTRNTFSNVKYGIGLKPAIFSERFLRRPPREATE